MVRLDISTTKCLLIASAFLSNTDIVKCYICTTETLAASDTPLYLSSPSNGSYYNDMSCAWRIVTTQYFGIIVIDIEEIDMQIDQGKCVDYLEIYDGVNTQSPSLARLCNTKDSLVTSDDIAYLWFHTDSSVTGKGFRLKYYGQMDRKQMWKTFITVAVASAVVVCVFIFWYTRIHKRVFVKRNTTVDPVFEEDRRSNQSITSESEESVGQSQIWATPVISGQTENGQIQPLNPPAYERVDSSESKLPSYDETMTGDATLRINTPPPRYTEYYEHNNLVSCASSPASASASPSSSLSSSSAYLSPLPSYESITENELSTQIVHYN